MIKCTVCGYENKDDAKFCLNCGSPIKHEKVSQAIDDVSEERTVLLDPESLRKRAEEDYKKEHDEQAPPPAEPPAESPPPPPAPMGAPPSPPPPVGAGQAAAPPPSPAAPPKPPRPTGAPPPPSGGAAPPPPGMAPAPPVGGAPGKTNVLAIVSLITGIIAVIGLCCYGVGGLVFGLVGAITGFLARKQIAESNGMESGDGMALAGMICGAASVVLGIIGFILFVVLGVAANMGGGGY
ncbi:DUF4190 domain-containing protein [bacterium]|nr:DUF4190 domain-containing protein [bacterium]